MFIVDIIPKIAYIIIEVILVKAVEGLVLFPPDKKLTSFFIYKQNSILYPCVSYCTFNKRFFKNRYCCVCIYSGTVEEAFDAKREDPCNFCALTEEAE